MIKIENSQTWGFEHTIRGMRNPFGSWSKSDSEYEDELTDITDNSGNIVYTIKTGNRFSIGEKDLKLMQTLIKAGSDHRKFMRQIYVSVDITAPMYWWKEFDTYKIGTVANSCSTMHTIHKKQFTDEMFSWDKCYISDWKQATLTNLNFLRARYNQTKDKKDWYALIQMLPSSFNQMRTVSMSYENLFNMYHSRKNHKLDEWHEFCEWVKGLPYAVSLIVMGGSNEIK